MMTAREILAQVADQSTGTWSTATAVALAGALATIELKEAVDRMTELLGQRMPPRSW